MKLLIDIYKTNITLPQYIFDDILDCDVWEVSEVSEADIVNNDAEIINAEDVL